VWNLHARAAGAGVTVELVSRMGHAAVMDGNEGK